ncbi:glycoside hydrolase family 15 protein [Pararoseomonas indoligenes]|uniref:Glycoside hydrolase family 15 protein n=1 Tax=Roseomonas indoligenes TaxID=2820811 RepID=A0A940S3P8_9PROT|nr:glycoside hydrolase family 15 protein [Pararoseomonas indoligenes]MBP0491174.1 glycoside hydrolase family 15 protein [Pararoseomonas indoligenes]
MSRPLADYALIGDTHSNALIARDGSIDWLCWPRHDSPALFLRLLDDEKGGACTVAFERLIGTVRRYLPGTNMLETVFTTATGRAVLTDFMPLSRPDRVAPEGPDGIAEGRVIRLLRCEEGGVSGRFLVRPTFDYARRLCAPSMQPDGTALFEAGEQRMLVVALPGGPAVEGEAVSAAFDLGMGERMALVLSGGEDGQTVPPVRLEEVEERLAATRHYWDDWSARCTYRGGYREAVLRSVLLLKLLTYSPTGAIIAAPTLGLPEAVPGNRNFDYRYAWLRDASFTVTSFVMLGYVREAAEYLRFLRLADPSRGRALKLMYAIDGGPPAAEEVLDHLSGWRGVGPIRIGNGAADQQQHDIYGEHLMALETFLEAVDYDPPQKTNDHLPEGLVNLATRALAVRHAEDQGIWEPRTPGKQMFHTKALIWVALDRAARMARRVGRIEEGLIRDWERVAEEVRAEYHERGWNPARGAFTQFYGSDLLDAAVLRTVLFGAIDANDPRLASTYDAITRELVVDDLVYRYRAPDGMEGEEGTFSACAFWRVGCLALAGRTEPARLVFERLLGRGNDLGLFAEEIDAATGEQRGNFPQGFTHMALINHALRLEREQRRRAA